MLSMLIFYALVEEFGSFEPPDLSEAVFQDRFQKESVDSFMKLHEAKHRTALPPIDCIQRSLRVFSVQGFSADKIIPPEL